jgi:hypothetical protein
MEIPKPVLFRKDHHKIRFMMAEIFQDTIFHLGFTNIMNLRVKLFQLLFPAAGFPAGGFVAHHLTGFHRNDVDAGAEMLAQLFQQRQASRQARVYIVQVECQQDAPELLKGSGIGMGTTMDFMMGYF